MSRVRTNSVSRFAPVAALSAVCALAALPSACAAQQSEAPQKVLVMLEQPFAGHVQDSSFANIAAMFSKSANLNIAADGEPILAKATLDFTGTLRQAVDAVAEKFDLQWTVTKSGIILMRKRFTDAADLPQFSLVETRQIVKDAIKALRTINYDPDPQAWVGQMQTLYQALTPQQIKTLRNESIVPATQFNANQMDVLTQIIYGSSFARPLSFWRELEEQITLLPGSYLKTVVVGGDPTDPKAPRYYNVRYVHPNKRNGLGFETFLMTPVDPDSAAEEQNKP